MIIFILAVRKSTEWCDSISRRVQQNDKYDTWRWLESSSPVWSWCRWGDIHRCLFAGSPWKVTISNWWLFHWIFSNGSTYFLCFFYHCFVLCPVLSYPSLAWIHLFCSFLFSSFIFYQASLTYCFIKPLLAYIHLTSTSHKPLKG